MTDSTFPVLSQMPAETNHPDWIKLADELKQSPCTREFVEWLRTERKQSLEGARRVAWLCKLIWPIWEDNRYFCSEYGWSIYQYYLKRTSDEINQSKTTAGDSLKEKVNVRENRLAVERIFEVVHADDLLIRVLSVLECGKIFKFLKQWNALDQIIHKVSFEVVKRCDSELPVRAFNPNHKIRAREVEYLYLRVQTAFHLRKFDEVETLYRDYLKWFEEDPNLTRWYAKTLQEQHRYEDAVEMMKLAIMRNPNQWYLYQDIALMYAEQQNEQKKLEFLMRVMLMGGEIEHKIKVIDLIAAHYETENQLLDAWMHYYLSWSISAELNWHKRAEWSASKCRSLPIEAHQLPGFASLDQPASVNQVQAWCKKHWVRESEKNANWQVGKIFKLLDNGNGFIEMANKKQVFFRQREFQRMNRTAPEIGQDVQFIVEPAFDRVKNRINDQATQTRLLQ